MLEPTVLTWILLVVGWILGLLLVVAQGLMALRPHSPRAREIVIGKGEEWRDRTHFKSAYGLAVADLAFQIPLLAAGSVGVLLGETWGYLLWGAAGALTVYINVVLWFLEREEPVPGSNVSQTVSVPSNSLQMGLVLSHPSSLRKISAISGHPYSSYSR